MVHHSVRHMSGIYQNNSVSSISQPINTSHYYRQQQQPPPRQTVQQRELAISPTTSQTNLCSVLQVETSVEYDLPPHIYPPKNSGPILMVHPDYNKGKDIRNKSTRRANSRATTYQSSNSSYNPNNKEYINCNGKRCNGKSSSTSIAKACYTITSCNNSPSSYTKSLNNSRTNYRPSAMLTEVNNTQEYLNNVARQKHRQNQMHQINPHHQQQHQQQQQNVAASMIPHRHIKYPTAQPPSYGTATRLSGLMPQAAHANGISTPMIASVVPADLKPQIMSTADTVRSRGSPKLRASTRRHAAAPDYQVRRNRSNTIGAQSNLANTSTTNPSSLASIDIGIASSLSLLQMQTRTPQIPHYDQLLGSSRMPTRHPTSNHQRSESDDVYSENKLKNVSAVPFIYEGRVADTPHVISGPLTPSEMMDQDPFPSRGMMSSVESSATPNVMSQDSRHLRYSDMKKPIQQDNGIESAKHYHQISSSASSGRHQIKDKNENYWYPEALKKSSEPKSHPKQAHSRAHGNSKSSAAEVRLKGCDRNNVWLKHLSNLFEDSLASPIDLTSPAKSSMQFSPSASLLSSQLLGVPTPPVSNLANGSGSIFQSNTSNFINNIYQLSNINPIYNLVY